MELLAARPLAAFNRDCEKPGRAARQIAVTFIDANLIVRTLLGHTPGRFGVFAPRDPMKTARSLLPDASTPATRLSAGLPSAGHGTARQHFEAEPALDDERVSQPGRDLLALERAAFTGQTSDREMRMAVHIHRSASDTNQGRAVRVA